MSARSSIFVTPVVLSACSVAALTLLISAPSHAEGLDLQAGGVVAVAPKYEGSKDYEVIGFPFIAPAGSSLGGGFVQFKGPDDLRFRVLNGGGFEAGPLVGWRFSRDEDDSSHLEGLGDVDGSVVVGGYAAYTAGIFTPFISYHYGVSGDDDTGGLIRFGSEAKLSAGSWMAVTATAGASYADDDYADTYFSVTGAQSSASGLDAYDANAGIKDVFVGFSADVPVAERWTLKLMGRYTHLLGDAADSPIVEDESQWFGGAGVTYKFNIAR